MGNNTALPGNQIHTTHTLLSLATEVLIEILAYLPPADMVSVQRTCRTIRDIVTDTAYLQYILHAKINRVDDLLPPEFPYTERLELLRCHEQSSRDLQFNLFAECHGISGVPYSASFTLQGGYLIYECVLGWGRGLQYGYTDLCSAEQNKELRWVHLTMGKSQWNGSTRNVFAVDHDLMMAVSHKLDTDSAVLVQLAFFEFSTGAPHPLAAAHIVSVSQLSELPTVVVMTEVLGDHILVTVSNDNSKAGIYLVSWKRGAVTLLRMLPARSPTLNAGRSMALSINSNLVSLAKDYENRLEICKLELEPVPRLETLCSLELPPLASGVSNFVLNAIREWVPTSKSYSRTRSSRGYHLPFYSSAIGTIALLFRHHLGFQSYKSHALIISVAALVSVLPTDVRDIPWEDWGPSSTHFFKLGGTGLMAGGPFWITDRRSLVVRQYDLRRTRYTHLTPGPKSSLPSCPPFNSKYFQYDIETRLQYDDVMMENMDFSRRYDILADREWVATVDAGRSITVYHVG